MSAYLDLGEVGNINLAIDGMDGAIRLLDLAVGTNDAQVEIPMDDVPAIIAKIVRAYTDKSADRLARLAQTVERSSVVKAGER